MHHLSCNSQRSECPIIFTLFAIALVLQAADSLKVRPSGNPVKAILPQNDKIYYNGGRLVTSANLYLIFYGDWGEAARNLTQTFIDSLNDDVAPNSVAGWWGITSQYYQAAGKLHLLRSYVRQKVIIAREIMDAYSRGRKLRFPIDINLVVRSSISSGKLPVDRNGIYFVLTAADVAITGFCTSFCGFHSAMTLASGVRVKFSLVSDPTQCLGACAPQGVSPNGMPGIDAMISTLAHELTETVTDPYGNGWLSDLGEENADMCAWTFGQNVQTGIDRSGKKYSYNMVGRHGTRFYVQQNWDRLLQQCAVQRA